MGKKIMKKSEKKPNHKIPALASNKKQTHFSNLLLSKTSKKIPGHKLPAVASKKKQKQQKKCTYSDVPLFEKKCLVAKQKLEELLQLGIKRNDESIQKQTRQLNETKDILKQRALARELVKNPLNYSLIPDHFNEETEQNFNKMIVSAGENLPGTVMGLLKGRLMDKFGASHSFFVDHLQENIWLKVLLRCLQDEDAGFSDERVAKIDPLLQLLLLNGCPSSEDQMKKVLVREFGLRTPWSYPVKDIITELVEKMVNAFDKVAPDDALALAVEGISLTG